MRTCGDTTMSFRAALPGPQLPGDPWPPHTCPPTGPLREAFLDSPKALAIEAGLVGCPGGVPACVLLRVGAAYLVGGDGAGLEAQGLVVGALCRTRETTRYRKATSVWLCFLVAFARLLLTPVVSRIPVLPGQDAGDALKPGPQALQYLLPRGHVVLDSNSSLV